MGSTQTVVPGWVVPTPAQVQDLHTIATAEASRSELARGCLDALDWVLDPNGPDMEQARAEATALAKHRTGYYRGISDTLAWLYGLLSHPWHLAIPRRNPDGSLLTADQIYDELLAAHSRPTPEQRDKARHEADVTAIRWARIFG